MKIFLAVVSFCFATGCTHRSVTQGAVEGSRAWFAEVEDGGGDDKIAIIVCDAKALPPCIRFAARNVKQAGEVQAWAMRSSAGATRTPSQVAQPLPATSTR